MTTYNECIPLLNNLPHADKLRLAQWLINIIAEEEGITTDDSNNQTGLCGIWQDSRSSNEILQDIISSRTQRDIEL